MLFSNSKVSYVLFSQSSSPKVIQNSIFLIFFLVTITNSSKRLYVMSVSTCLFLKHLANSLGGGGIPYKLLITNLEALTRDFKFVGIKKDHFAKALFLCKSIFIPQNFTSLFLDSPSCL